ncbi:MAG: tetratricopeptide repeat protein [Verrucomicrobiaceae bacterium]|nr:tetratricopeptide repeat protein [Verrucomicrobiaceae bacterium]
MNLTLQSATIIASLYAAMLLNAGNNPTAANSDKGKIAERWAASVSAEQSGDFAEALNQAGAWMAASGDNYLGVLRAGWLNYSAQDYPKAAAYYAQAAKTQPTALTPLLGLLTVAQAMGDAEKIQSSADRVLKIEPTNYKALMAAGGALLARGDHRKARGFYARVLAIYPEDTDAQSGAAWCSFYLGDRREALKAFQAIAMVNPSYPFVQEGLDLSAH